MDYTIELALGGYRILDEGSRVVIEQPFDPSKPFASGVPQPFDSAAAAQAHADAAVAAMTP